MGGSLHLAGRFGCTEERSVEERTAERSPGSGEKIAAAVCKDGAPVETSGIERVNAKSIIGTAQAGARSMTTGNVSYSLS
jgi:hypothetical protein